MTVIGLVDVAMATSIAAHIKCKDLPTTNPYIKSLYHGARTNISMKSITVRERPIRSYLPGLLHRIWHVPVPCPEIVTEGGKERD